MTPRALPLLPLLLLHLAGCANVGAPGSPCFDNGTCDDGLVCVEGLACAEAAPASINFFEAAEPELTLGEPAVLFWSATAARCFLDGQPVDPADTATRDLVQDETFTLRCEGPAGDEAIAVVDVTVTPPAPPPLELELTASATQIALGDELTLTWSAPAAETCTLDDGSGPDAVLPADSETFSPAATTTFTLSCTNEVEELARSVDVHVLRPPTISDLTAAGTVRFLDPVLVSWSSVDATSCELEHEGVVEVVPTSAVDQPLQIRALPRATATVRLRCFGALGPAAVDALDLVVDEVVVDGDIVTCAFAFPCIERNAELLATANRVTGFVALQSNSEAVDHPRLVEVGRSLGVLGAAVPLVRFENLRAAPGGVILEPQSDLAATLPGEFDWGPLELDRLEQTEDITLEVNVDRVDAPRLHTLGLLRVRPNLAEADKCTRLDFPALTNANLIDISDARVDLLGGFPVLERVFTSITIFNETGMSEDQLQTELPAQLFEAGGAVVSYLAGPTPSCPE